MAGGSSRGLRPWARDLAAGMLLQLGLTRPDRSAAGLLTVATLHRVLPEEALGAYPLPQIAVTTEELRWLVGFLGEHFTCATLSEAHRRWEAGERPRRPLLALTFDDGQLDNFLHARPVLDAAGVPGTFFVPVEAVERNQPLWHDRMGYAVCQAATRDRAAALSLLGALPLDRAGEPLRLAAQAVALSKALPDAVREELADRLEAVAGGPARPAWDGMMSWDQLRTLAAGGHEVGSHSLGHALLTGVDDARLEREVAGSKARIEAALGRACAAFCYPNGDCDPRVVEAVRRAGYQRAVVTAWGPVRPGADAHRLTRCDLQGRTARDRAGRLSPARLALRLSPLFARLRP